MKKEIMFVSNFLGNGGAARVITVLANEFVKKGYAVSICSFSFDNVEEYHHFPGINYIKIKTTQKKGFFYKIERILKLREEIKKRREAVIISFEYFMNMQTVVAMFGLNNRLIISERNDPSRVGGKTPTKQIRNFLYQFADCLVCQTQEALEYFPNNIQRKAVIILNPIKADLPDPFYGVRKKEIVNFCRLEKQKNLPLLIDAFEIFYNNHPDFVLKIYGDGNECDNIHRYIKSRKLNDAVILHPAVQDIHERIKDATMFVSSSDYEGLSNSMIEAMAIGLPTICTDCPCGGARMVIKNYENGLLVSAGNRSELTGAMRLLADNNELCEKISNRSVSIVNDLSAEKIAQCWERIIVEGRK